MVQVGQRQAHYAAGHAGPLLDLVPGLWRGAGANSRKLCLFALSTLLNADDHEGLSGCGYLIVFLISEYLK